MALHPACVRARLRVKPPFGGLISLVASRVRAREVADYQEKVTACHFLVASRVLADAIDEALERGEAKSTLEGCKLSNLDKAIPNAEVDRWRYATWQAVVEQL